MNDDTTSVTTLESAKGRSRVDSTPSGGDGGHSGDRERSLRMVGNISYLLHTIVAIGAVIPGVQASVLLLLVAFILDLVKKGEAAGTWQASHFSWRIRTVCWAAGLYLVTAPLWLLLLAPGWIAWGLISIWFLYRVVRGWMRLGANEAMPA